MFEQGAIKLLALGVLAERPCHGYDLIKAIEDLVGGDYSPSPGVIYPTLAYLADMGWATAADDAGGRRQYTITAGGREQLERQRDELAALQDRLRGVRREASARGAPEIQRAMDNLKATLRVRFARGPAATSGTADAELIRQVAALIDAAAAGIARL
ncbi:MAG: PadR family transcriptional regulator [Proteobacteria bacterium]|nr:PadR family transcriptional regulator [Pseudomonadota bacterium]